MPNKHINIRTFTWVLASFFSMCISSYAEANNDINAINTNSCLSSKANANDSDSFFEQLTSKDFKLLGQAKLSILFWDIYESKLFTSDGKLPLSGGCQYSMFEIKYLRDITKQELLDNTLSQWQHLAIKQAEYTPYLAMLESIWPDIKSGDQLTLLNNATTTVFYFNKKKVGEIESEQFADLFLRIWLDENTSEPKLRQQLLGDLI